MTVATSLTPDRTEALLASVFLAHGYEPPSAGKPHQIELSVHSHSSGSVVREVWTTKRWERSVGEAFAEAVVSEGGWVLLVSAGEQDSALTRWDTEGSRVSNVATPTACGLNLVQRQKRAERALMVEP